MLDGVADVMSIPTGKGKQRRVLMRTKKGTAKIASRRAFIFSHPGRDITG